MNTFDIHSKITWHELIKQTDILPFYPSLTKKIDKSDEYFSQNFFIKVTPILDVDSNASDFFDLYEKEIGARENYIYKKDEQKEILKKNIENGRVYFLIGCYLKDNNKFCGGLIFSKKDGNFFSALRVFESQIRSQYKSQTTLDFWTEKEFYNYAKSEKVKFISHGTDNYPNIGRVGLPLFKLKVGAIPKISNKEHEIKKLTDQYLLDSDSPILFFDNPDKDDYFKSCHLFYKEGKIDESVLGELKKVLQWAEISLFINS